MYILDWRILKYKSFWSFAANHLEYDENGKLRRCLNTDYLVGKIAPYAYQVKKSECLSLPKKTYDTVYYDLTKEQDMHYEYVADSLLFTLDEIKGYTIYRFFTALQLVISGYLVDTSKQTSDGEVHIKKEPFFKEPLKNPRLKCLMNIIDGMQEKCIVFCKYTYEIEIITDLINKKYGDGTAVSYNGNMNLKSRQKNLDEFKGKVQFLIANKTCAGYGLNLQFCSYVIFYSNDFDYATRSQAEDRVHRIGQDRNVHIIDICAANTLDEKIIKCLNKKENLLDSFKNELEKKKDLETVISWIRKKDYRGKNYYKKITDADKGDLKEE